MHQSYWADSKWLETAQEYIWPSPNSIKFFDIFPASSKMFVARLHVWPKTNYHLPQYFRKLCVLGLVATGDLNRDSQKNISCFDGIGNRKSWRWSFLERGQFRFFLCSLCLDFLVGRLSIRFVAQIQSGVVVPYLWLCIFLENVLRNEKKYGKRLQLHYSVIF